ncbi:ABC transporter ATP-binding protein [Streptomyces sp. ST2-7A]|uniref:ABC transporter ATP-binding protein n=1 Tax=Streptomyces sp. ST2-7A TaxID=2907214 RepID=UPI001F3AB837|nr:ATP-binding cassette domain-containing protein [Streptomyces sp. ST2-7A]MCE7079598.1 ATP-binding cassette domain-containing protein [Streptomyces sp. ST2-7A]
MTPTPGRPGTPDTAPGPPAGPPLLAAGGLLVRRVSDATTVLAAPDIRLDAGRVLVVTGPSGLGKSTLLHALLDILPPGLRRVGGTVLWYGEPVRPGAPARRVRRARCGWLGQDPAAELHPRLRVDRLIAEGLSDRHPEAGDRAAALLERLGLDPGLLRRRATELSGGQAQRVALARALIGDPELLVVDEPTSALDAGARALVEEAVRAHRDRPGRAAVVVTHDPGFAEALGDTVLRLEPPVTGASGRTTARPAPVPEPPGAAPIGTSPPFVPPGGGMPVAAPFPTVPTETVVPALSVRGLRLELPDGSPLLESCDLDLPRGGALAITGASGSGKTTLLHTVCGRRPPASGRILLHGAELPAATRYRERDHLRAIQLVGQSPLGELNPAHRAVTATARPLRVLHGLDRKAARAGARELLIAVGLEPEHLRRRPRELSGGQRQRVVLARALAARPDILLLDEPTAALDRPTAERVLDLLDRLRAEGLALLMVTHDPLVAARADRTLRLEGSRLVGPAVVDGAGGRSPTTHPRSSRSSPAAPTSGPPAAPPAPPGPPDHPERTEHPGGR